MAKKKPRIHEFISNGNTICGFDANQAIMNRKDIRALVAKKKPRIHEFNSNGNTICGFDANQAIMNRKDIRALVAKMKTNGENYL